MTNGGGGMYIRDMAGSFVQFLNSDPLPPCCPDWQPIAGPQPGYARPISASPSTVKLVPAYKGCASANSTHGAPLSRPSCNPPQQASNYLTIGTPDANGAAANSTGSIAFRVFCHPPDANGVPECPASGDQIAVALTVSLTDVRNNADLTDYTGELRVFLGIRLTDRYNLPGGVTPGTAGMSFPFKVNCVPTADETVGSNCSTQTSADAVMPGIALEGKRAVWGFQLPVQVFDGGVDGDADTPGGDTLFMKQGLFLP
jgi:hypothetical protein